MLSIDNSVELMLKTYLNLPRRETALEIPGQDLKDAQRSFPGLLSVMERYAPAKLAGVSLTEIEWYHGLRNELYHQGNGLTVEQSKVETYAGLAGVLFANLFGHELRPPGTEGADWPAPALGGETAIDPETWKPLPTSGIPGLIEAAAVVDQALAELASNSDGGGATDPTGKLEALVQDGVVSASLARAVRGLRRTRQDLVAGSVVPSMVDRRAGEAWKVAKDLLDLASRVGAGDRAQPMGGIDSDWDYLERRASEELFRTVRTLWDRIDSAVKVATLPWVPRLYVRHGYFTFQQTTGRRNVIGCVFRTGLDRAELSISLPAAPERLGLGQLFSNPQHWDHVHSQVLILVDDKHGTPDIGKAVAISRRFNA
jgi:hypothetical protein